MVELAFTAPQSWAWEQIQNANGPLTLCMPWGRGCGKSWFERTAGIYLQVAKWYGVKRIGALDGRRGVRLVGLCPTLKQWKDIHGASIEDELNGQWRQLGGKLNRSTYEIEWPDGSWFRPMPAAMASSKAARGLRCDAVVLDECDDIPLEVYHSVIKPWFSEPWSLKLTLPGGTPRMGRAGLLYHLHSLGKGKTTGRYRSRVFTYRDCPEIVDPAEVEDARANTPAGTFAREWECDFDSAEGLVLPGFDEDFHVRIPHDSVRFRELSLGIDHGWSDPGVFLVGGVVGHGEDAILWILDEQYASEQPNHVWDSIAREKYPGYRAFADPSRPDRINDLRRQGLAIQGADNSIDAGIGRIAEMLHIRQSEDGRRWARMFVHPRCVNTIRELKNYKRKPDPMRPGQFLDEYIDRDNHTIDSLRYLTVGLFGRPANIRHEVRGT